MAGMIQILTYLLSFYLVVKGIEILQIALASNRPKRGGLIVFGSRTLVACMLAAFAFVVMQDHQAIALSNSKRH
jgi:hypothetical protein